MSDLTNNNEGETRMAHDGLPIYTMMPNDLRVSPGWMGDDREDRKVSIQARDKRCQVTIPLSATDAAVMARLLWMFANNHREEDGLPAFSF